MGKEPCEFAKLYSDYVKGTKFEMYYNPHSDYNPVICCHEKAPFIILHGERDNFQCEKAKACGQCPLRRKPKNV